MSKYLNTNIFISIFFTAILAACNSGGGGGGGVVDTAGGVKENCNLENDSNGECSLSGSLDIPTQLHGTWVEENCHQAEYIPSSTHYKILVTLTKDQAVVTRKTYQGDNCANGVFLGDLIYVYKIAIKNQADNKYDFTWMNASFKPGTDVTHLNASPKFCDLDWAPGVQQSIFDQTCEISGQNLNFLTLHNFKDPEGVTISIDSEGKLSNSFDLFDLKFTKLDNN